MHDTRKQGMQNQPTNFELIPTRRWSLLDEHDEPLSLANPKNGSLLFARKFQVDGERYITRKFKFHALRDKLASIVPQCGRLTLPLEGESKITVCSSEIELANGIILICGGWLEHEKSTHYLTNTWFYNPATRQIAIGPHMNHARESNELTLLSDERVLVTGGTDEHSKLVAVAEIYDPKTNTFTVAGTMQNPRAGHSTVELANGNVLIVGGYSRLDDPPGCAYVNTSELYDPRLQKFVLTGNPAQERMSPTLVIHQGTPVLAGGYTFDIHESQPDHLTLFATTAELYTGPHHRAYRASSHRMKAQFLPSSEHRI